MLVVPVKSLGSNGIDQCGSVRKVVPVADTYEYVGMKCWLPLYVTQNP